MNEALKKVITFGFREADPDRLPPAANDENDNPLGAALVVTQNSRSLEWAPRWLGHAGFEVESAQTHEAMHAYLSAKCPALVMIDASMADARGRRLFEIACRSAGDDTVVFVLCATPREVREVSSGSGAEVVRKPYDWELIARRAARSIESRRMARELRDTKNALQNARISAADARRHLSTMTGLDILTQLPARERFRTLAQRTISGAGEDSTAGVLVMALNRFRLVNEAIGHEAANQVLSQFAERLKERLQDRELVGGDAGTTLTAAAGRISGMRFAVVLSRATDENITRLRDAVRSDLEKPFEINGQSIYLSVTMGAALFPTDATTADGLLHSAERALEQAKEAGSRFRFFSTGSGDATGRAVQMDTMLRQAVAKHELTLAYQPIMDRLGKRIVAAEALLRWDHDELGSISPADFVPVAERAGLMVRIGHSVLRQAVRQVRAWADAGYRPVRVAVNLSLCQLLDCDIVHVIDEALKAYKVRPQLLELELSERGVLNHGKEVVEVIQRVKELGVRISIDDFGAGNAAISYLKDLPADVVKIDRSYVSGKGRNSRDIAIGAGMVALAKRLDTQVIAEGVETQAQHRMVREWGCDELQGFYFGKATTPENIAGKLLRRRSRIKDAAQATADFTGIFRPVLRPESLPDTS